MTGPAPDLRAGGRNLARALFPFAVALLLGGILYAARGALGPYLLGLLMAYLLLPVVHRIEGWMPEQGRWGAIRRPVAAALTGIGTLGLVVFFLGVLIEPVIDQTGELFDDFGDYWADVQAEHDGVRHWYEDVVPEELRAVIDRNITRIGQSIAAGVAGILRWLLSSSGSILSAASALFAVPLFVIYYLLEEQNTAANLRRQLPRAWVGDLVAIFRIFDRILGSYTRGVVMEAIIVGVITGVGYWLIGVELALPLGVIAFAGEIVPILGPWIAFFISFPVVLATQPELALPALLLFAVIQAIEGWVIAPRAGDTVEMTSAGTLLVIAIGGGIGGALGVVFALPAAAILRALCVYTASRLDGDSPDKALSQLRVFRPRSDGVDDLVDSSRTA